MAAEEKKGSTLILKVDLDCCHCYKKIKSVLCKLQVRWSIKTIVYDDKKGTVTISGPFDPDKLSIKLRCKACQVITDIQIKAPDPPPKPKPVDPPPPPKPVQEVVIEFQVGAPPPPPPKPTPPPPPKPQPVVEPVPACQPAGWPHGGPQCCCWYHGSCRCCSCGRSGGYGGGWMPMPVPVPVAQPPPVVIYGGPWYNGGYKGCEMVCEAEDRSCGMM